MPPHYLARVSEFFQTNGTFVAASNPFLFFDGSLLLRFLVKFFFCHFLSLYAFLVRMIRGPVTLFGGNFSVRADTLEEIGGFNTGIEFFGEDVHFSKRISRKGPAGFIPDLFTQTSARRYVKNGFFKTQLLYMLNLLSIIYCDKSFTYPSINVRKVLKYGFVVFTVSILLYAITSPTSEIFGKVTHHVKGNKKVIALTFDDGPNGQTTQRILDTLEQEKVKATFFLIGKNVEKYPDIAREIVDRGHSIGNHSYTHPWELPFENKRALTEEIDKTETAIYQATGEKTTLFRPPHGFRTPWMMTAIKQKGYQIVTWDDMTYDYVKYSKPRYITKKIVSRAKPGSIIVLHDGLDLNHGIERKNTDEALGYIIRELKNKGFDFITLD
jgi:peptidoglycan-N-acetylglucosamine deacetylase